MRAVRSTHWLVETPAKTSERTPRLRSSASSPVDVNALEVSFVSTGSPACGATSSRIVYTELLQSRQEAAAERAAQAQAYKKMFNERAAEHAEFTTVMTDRLAARDKSIKELEATIVLAETRAI